MNSNEECVQEGIAALLVRDHKELMRQAWILFMLDTRREWFDVETIEDRALELEAFLKRHLDSEEASKYKINNDIERGTVNGASGHDQLLQLLSQVGESEPLTEKWERTFQNFETKLCEHVGDSYMPSESTDEGSPIRCVKDEGDLLTTA